MAKNSQERTRTDGVSGPRLLAALTTGAGLAAATGFATAYGLPRLAASWAETNRLTAVIVLEVYVAIIVGHVIAFGGLEGLRARVRLRSTTPRELVAALALWAAAWAAAVVLYFV